MELKNLVVNAALLLAMSLTMSLAMSLGLASHANAGSCDTVLQKVDHRTYSSCTITVDGKPTTDLTEFSISNSSGMVFSNGKVTQHAHYYHFVLGSKNGGARGFSGFTSGFDEQAEELLGTPSHNVCDENSLSFVTERDGQQSSRGRLVISADGNGIQASVSRAGKPELTADCKISEVKK